MKNFLIAAVAFLSSAGIVFFAISKTQKGVSPIFENRSNSVKEKPLPTTVSNEKVYEDESGFNFSYSSDLTVTKKKLASTDYAYLELTSPVKKGSITLQVSDSPYKNLTEWRKKNSKTSDSATDAKLADLSAKTLNSKDSALSAAIDQDGVLYLLTTKYENEEKYWTSAVSIILDSFKFQSAKSSPGAENQANTENSETAVEEEIIE